MKRKESQQKTVNLILDSAQKNFAQYGFHSASVETITEQAGFSRGAFYANFTSKEDLFLKLLSHRMEGIVANLQSLLRDPLPAGNPLAKWKEFYQNRAMNGELTLLMAESFLLSSRDSPIKEDIRKLNKKYIEMVSVVIAKVFPGTDGVGLSAEEKALYLLSFGEGLMLQHLADPKKVTAKRVQKLLQNCFDRILLGSPSSQK